MDKLAGGVLAPQKSVPLKNAVAFPCKPVEFCIAVEIVLINVLQSSQLASLKKGKKYCYSSHLILDGEVKELIDFTL